ncbi:MAG: peptidyl-alpha-hydroxyglycine alpha-amidating lyase family protein [Thermoguttaceae bacterium]
MYTRFANRSNRCALVLATALVPVIVVLMLRSGADSTAADLPVAVSEQSERVNLATSYRVDPSWPQRPDDVQWGKMAGVTIDAKGQIWLHTRANPPVQVYDADGRFIRGWGEDIIESAHYLRIDHEGKVWASDIGKHVIMQFTPEGKLLKTLGTPGEPGEDETHLNKPTDMAVTPDGDVFVSDGYGNSRIVHFDRHGKFVKAWGKRGTGPGEFNLPHSIVVDSQGILYVADRSNARIQVFDQTGKFLAQWCDLLVPWGLAVTGNDEIWACGSSPMVWPEDGGLLGCPPKDQLFMRLDRDGKLLQLWTIPKGEDGQEKPGELNWLHAIAEDAHGNIYAGDIIGERAQKFVRQD